VSGEKDKGLYIGLAPWTAAEMAAMMYTHRRIPLIPIRKAKPEPVKPRRAKVKAARKANHLRRS
jgi:hypothetical protein